MKKIAFVIYLILGSWLSPTSYAQCGDTLNCSGFVQSFPYFEDFENGKGGWYHGKIQATFPNPSQLPSPVPHFPGFPVNDSWAFGTPAKIRIVGAASGDSCWVSGGLTGNYPREEHSYVTSPCFDFTNLTSPFLSLKINYDTETNIDGAVIQVSADSGKTWTRLGDIGGGLNWYNRQSLFASPGRICAPANGKGWGGRSFGWRPAFHDFFAYAGLPHVQIRIVFASDFLTSFEGFAFDDVIISDSLHINAFHGSGLPYGYLGPDTTVCMPFDIGFAQGNNIPGSSFLWNTGDTTPYLQATSAGLYWLEVQVGTQTIRDTIILSAIPPPIVDLGPDTAFCHNSFLNLIHNLPNIGVSFRVYDTLQIQFIPANISPSFPILITSTTTLEATLTTTQGCTVIDTVFVEEMPPLQVDSIQVSPDFGSSDGTAKAFISGNYGNPIFDWGPLGNGQTTDSIFSLNTGSDTLMIRDALGCEGMSTYDIPYATGVYPGDTDHNQVVNMNDLLPIGVHFSKTGPLRPNASLQWIPQLAPLWGDTLANGKDLRHTDCDGDGIITLDDTLAVNLNFGNLHNNQRLNGRNQGPLLQFMMPSANLQAGDTIRVPITIGTVDTQAINLFGLAFSIVYDTALVEEGSVEVDFSNSWLGVQNTNMIAMYRDDYAAERLHIGMVRYDTIQRSGYGHLADVIVVIDDHIAKREIPFVLEFSAIYGIERNENSIEIQGKPGVGAISTALTDNFQHQIEVFPQPAQEVVYVRSSAARLLGVKVSDLQGRLVGSVPSIGRTSSAVGTASQRIEVDLSQLAGGIYMLKIETNQGFVWRKIYLVD